MNTISKDILQNRFFITNYGNKIQKKMQGITKLAASNKF